MFQSTPDAERNALSETMPTKHKLVTALRLEPLQSIPFAKAAVPSLRPILLMFGFLFSAQYLSTFLTAAAWYLQQN
jgi:hypothetical protein